MDTDRRYDYRFRDRYGGALWAGGYALGVLAVPAYAAAFGRGAVIAVMLIAIVSLPLALAGVLAQIRTRGLLRAVVVSREGLGVGPAGRGPDAAPAVFVPWAHIERIEDFRAPDPDARRFANRGGVRIIARGRRLVIYDHIGDYAGLRARLDGEAHIPAAARRR